MSKERVTIYRLTQWMNNEWRITQTQNTITENQQPLIEQVSKGQLVFVFASGRKTEAVIFHVSLNPASFNMNSFFSIGEMIGTVPYLPKFA